MKLKTVAEAGKRVIFWIQKSAQTLGKRRQTRQTRVHHLCFMSLMALAYSLTDERMI